MQEIHTLVLYMFLSQAASVSLWQMLEVNSVSLSCSFLSHSCTVSSAGLCLLAELSLQGCAPSPWRGCRLCLFSSLWDVRHSLSSFLLAWIKCTRVSSLRRHFRCYAFCFFSQVFVCCHLEARGWQQSHQTDSWNIFMLSLKLFMTIYKNRLFILALSSVCCSVSFYF